jgi:hypothetical protein
VNGGRESLRQKVCRGGAPGYVARGGRDPIPGWSCRKARRIRGGIFAVVAVISWEAPGRASNGPGMSTRGLQCSTTNPIQIVLLNLGAMASASRHVIFGHDLNCECDVLGVARAGSGVDTAVGTSKRLDGMHCSPFSGGAPGTCSRSADNVAWSTRGPHR